MTVRAYGVLSPPEFESFVAALLGAFYRRRYTRFAAGADAGVDLCYGPEGRLHVVQCKHYIGSSVSKLISDLGKELPKVAKLNPKSYKVVTSLPLGRKSKLRILNLFSGYMQSVDDVIARDDLDSMLDEHPKVERNTVKLWLASHAVLDAVLHRGTYQRTEALLEEIRRSLRLYVANSSYRTARKMLRERRVCVIAGDPGVGKSMLAKMLVARYLSFEYEPVFVSENIKEAWDMYEPDLKQVFYYDDFLGRTNFIEKLGKNEDQDLWRLIDRVAATRNKVLLLTTRDYILNQAEMTYARLGDLSKKRYQYLFRMPEYTRLEKAQILFNHLYHSQLGQATKRAIQRDRGYFKIIDHENYTPRNIEEISSAALRLDPRAAHFTEQALRVLNDPSLIWREAVEVHMSEQSRALVLLLATMPAGLEADDLERAYEALHVRRFGRPAGSAFVETMKALDGSFLRISAVGSARLVRFDKPSQTDFALSYLDKHPSETRLLVESCTFFEQVELLIGYAATQSSSSTGRTYPGIARALEPDAVLAAIERCFPEESAQRVPVLSGEGESIAARWTATPERRLTRVLALARQPRFAVLRPWIWRQISRRVKGWEREDGNLVDASSLLNAAQKAEVFDRADLRRLIERLHRVVLEGTTELEGYEAYFTFERFWPIDNNEWDTVRSRFKSIATDLFAGLPSSDELDSVESHSERLGLDFAAEVGEERERLRERAERDYEPDFDADEGPTGSRRSVEVLNRSAEDSLIRAMFLKLA